MWLAIFEALAARSPGSLALIDSQVVRAHQHAAGGRAHLPTTRQKRHQISVPPELSRQRNPIERCFNRLKHFRRLATRVDKLARNYLSTVALAATRLWTRFEART